MRTNTKTPSVAVWLGWLLPVLALSAACFKHPADKWSQMRCQTDNQCPNGYKCWVPSDGSGSCHKQDAIPDAGGTTTSTGGLEDGGQPDSPPLRGGTSGAGGDTGGVTGSGGQAGGAAGHVGGSTNRTDASVGGSASGGKAGGTAGIAGAAGTGGNAGTTRPMAGTLASAGTLAGTSSAGGLSTIAGGTAGQTVPATGGAGGQSSTATSTAPPCDRTTCAEGCCVGTKCMMPPSQNVNMCGQGAIACTTCAGGICNDGRCECPQGLMPCFGACVDRETDPKNCGTCGSTCQGTNPGCASGLCFGTISSKVWTRSGPIRMAANATDVYITLEGEGTVTRIARRDGKPQGLWSQQAAPAAIAVDAKNVYWVNKGSGDKTGAIMKLPLGSTEPVTLATGEPNPQELAIDGTNVYWTNLSGSIKKAPIAGGEVVTLAAGTTMGNVHAIAVDSTNVYWTVVGEGLNAGSVMTVPSKGGASTAVLDARNLTEGSIALLGNWVYFVELNAPDTGLHTVEKTGGSAYYVRKVDMNLPAPLTSDSTYVYLGTRGGILRFKAGDGSSKTISGSVATSIAVDDTSILWTTDSGSLAMVPKP